MATRQKINGLTPGVFTKLYKAKDQGNFYVLAGEDSIIVDQLFKSLKAEFIESGMEDFNLETMHGGNVTASEIINSAETLPFLGGFRLVLVRHADELSGGDLEELNEYLKLVQKSPREDLLLLLCFEKIDSRTKFAKALKKANTIVNCTIGQLKDPNKIAQEKYNKRFSPAAEQLFLSLIGQNARTARTELEKLCLYLGDREEITEADVLNVCADNSTKNEWELAVRLLKGDFPSMIELLTQVRNSGIDPIYLHTIIAMTIGKLPSARQAYLEGSLASRQYEFRIHASSPDFRAFTNNISGINNQKLIEVLRYLMYAEIGVKGSSLPKNMIADMACYLASNAGEE